MPMTADELRAIRAELGLSTLAFGRDALELDGNWQGRTIRRYEAGTSPIPGPVAVASRLLLEKHRRKKR